MAMFFSGQFSQTAFNIVCRTIRLFVAPDKDIPSSFNACSKVILDLFNDNTSFEKQLWCRKCQTIIPNPDRNRFLKRCKICSDE